MVLINLDPWRFKSAHSTNNEYAFRSACVNGHLQLAQWLYIIKPTINISAENDQAIRLACEYEYLEVAQWLYEIKPTIDI